MNASNETSGGGLYARIADAFERAIKAPQIEASTSGFDDPAAQDDAGAWRPVAELPEHIFDRKAIGNAARICLFDGRIYVALNGGRLTDFDRKKLAGTIQPLILILNGRAMLEMHYPFDGCAEWTCFRADIPGSPAEISIHTVEIDHDGKLLFSGRVNEDPGAKGYRAAIWFVNAAGRLSGGVTGSNCDVPVAVRMNGQDAWTITAPISEPGRPRRFEFDLKTACADGRLVRVSVCNPATGMEAACSPVGVFASQGEHFLIAAPRIAGGQFRAVLMSWKDGKRRNLAIGDVTRPSAEIVCRVDGADPQDARFDGGHNSFEIDAERLRSGDLAILDDTGRVLGALPELDQIAALM